MTFMIGFRPSYIGYFMMITFLLGLCILNGRDKHNRVPYFRSEWLTIFVVGSLIFIWPWAGEFIVDLLYTFPLRNMRTIVFIVHSIISLPFMFVTLKIAWGIEEAEEQ